MTRSDKLLLLIEETCERFSFWKPPSGNKQDYCKRLEEWLYIDGSGDASALRSLIRKCLIDELVTGGVRLGYRITDDGKLRAQTLA